MLYLMIAALTFEIRAQLQSRLGHLQRFKNTINGLSAHLQHASLKPDSRENVTFQMDCEGKLKLLCVITG